MDALTAQIIIAFAFGVTFVVALMVLAIKFPHPTNVSYESDVTFDPYKPVGDPIHKQINRVVPGKGTDRFVLVLGHKENHFGTVTYKFQITLLHDDNRCIELGVHRVDIKGSVLIHERADIYSIPVRKSS